MEVKLADYEEVPGLDCPVEFWPAIGYQGEKRYVAIWWEPGGDEACWSDGRKMVVGAGRWAYLALVDHNFPWGHKARQLLGSSEESATHRLIIDRQTERAWLVPAKEAEEILGLQHSVLETAARTLVVGVDWKTSRGGPGELTVETDTVQRAMEQEAERYELLNAALATRKSDARQRWRTR